MYRSVRRLAALQGGVALTLLDSLGALLIFGKADQFKAAADLVEHQVAFNSSGEVHVFELTIRCAPCLTTATALQNHLESLAAEIVWKVFVRTSRTVI